VNAIATLFELDAPAPSHPAKYTDALLVTMAQMLRGSTRILDPFAGTGKCFLLERFLPDCVVSGVEIEEEWCLINPRTTLGNALHLPWPDDTFDAVNTSPVYGNRMSDTFVDGSKRMTYTARLGRKLHPDNAGQLQWGPKYREFHTLAWTEARRVLVASGAFVLNVKDFIRDGKRVEVTDWHIECLESLGFRLLQHEQIVTPSHRYGANSEARMPYESIILFRLEPTQ